MPVNSVTMGDKVTAPKVRAMKGRQPIVCVTAYDASSGAIAEEAGVDVVLVGDSVGNVVLGYETTVPVTLSEMLHHVRAVARVCRRPLLVADMPFGSYQESVSQAVASAVALMKDGAEAVKLEGDYPEVVQAFTKAGIPVMGHVGMTPQSVHRFGGFRVQGRGSEGPVVVSQAQRLDEAGAFGIVLELIPTALAAEVTTAVSCPTIGIGAGPHCDGQIQVFHDLVGLSAETFRHARRYGEARSDMVASLSRYAKDVREAAFPTEENSF